MHLSAALLAPTPTTGVAEPLAGRATRRRATRRTLRLDALTTSPGMTLVTVHDISTGGLLIEGPPGALSNRDHLTVELPEVGQVGARVIWQSGCFSGCEFTAPVSASAVSAALLKGKPAPLAGTEVVKPAKENVRKGTIRFEPELNFSVPVSISVALWALLAVAAFIFAM